MGGLSKLFGKKKIEDLPERYVDPKFTGAQQTLYDFGTEGVAGKFNDYYAPIGSYGGKELDDMITLNTADIQRSGAESAAARGISGSRALAATSKSIADMSTNMRYSDFVRAMGGRQTLLGASTDAVRDVRNAATDEMASKNAYTLANANYKAQQKASNDAKLNSLISNGLSLAAMFVGGPVAAGAVKAATSGGAASTRGSAVSPNGFISDEDVDAFGSDFNFAM